MRDLLGLLSSLTMASCKLVESVDAYTVEREAHMRRVRRYIVHYPGLQLPCIPTRPRTPAVK